MSVSTELLKVERYESNVAALVRGRTYSLYLHLDAPYHWSCHPRHHPHYRHFGCEGNGNKTLVSLCLNLLLF